MKPLEHFLGLHQVLQVFYIPDGYLAQLLNEKDDSIIAVASGKTIETALVELKHQLNLPHIDLPIIYK